MFTHSYTTKFVNGMMYLNDTPYRFNNNGKWEFQSIGGGWVEINNRELSALLNVESCKYHSPAFFFQEKMKPAYLPKGEYEAAHTGKEVKSLGDLHFTVDGVHYRYDKFFKAWFYSDTGNYGDWIENCSAEITNMCNWLNVEYSYPKPR